MDFVDIGLKFTYALLGIGVIAAIAMPLIQALTTDPKSLVKSAMGVGVIVVIYFIGYAMSGNEVTATYAEFGVDSVVSQRVGGLLNAMYILMICALAGILFTEVSKLAK
jgi:hypothetical protein